MRTEQTLAEKVERLTEEDVRRSAEAVVDAAIWRQKINLHGQKGDVSETTRKALIQLIIDDPSQTALLFEDYSWERH